MQPCINVILMTFRDEGKVDQEIHHLLSHLTKTNKNKYNEINGNANGNLDYNLYRPGFRDVKMDLPQDLVANA